MGSLMQGFREDRGAQRGVYHTRWGWKDQSEMGGNVGPCEAGTEDLGSQPPSKWLPEGVRLLTFWVGEQTGSAARSAAFLEQALPALDYLRNGGDRAAVEAWFDGTFGSAKPKQRARLLQLLEDAECQKAAKAAAKDAAKGEFQSPFAGLSQLLKR